MVLIDENVGHGRSEHARTYEEQVRRKASWSAIFAGAAVAIAVMALLGMLGAGLGFWAVEPGGETDTLMGMAMGSTIYLLIAQLIALFVGGYVASRMSAAWDVQNAVLHGVTVWAIATLATIYIAMSAAGAMFATTMSAVTSSGSAVASAIQGITPDDLPSFELPEVEMSDLPPRVQEALREEGMTAQNFKAEAREAFRAVISEQEQEAARTAVIDAAVAIIRSPGDAETDIERMVDDLLGEGGVISEEDRRELADVMENRLGISGEEAEEMVANWEARVEEAYSEAKDAVVAAKRKAIDYGDAATDALSAASFAAFFSFLLGLIAAGVGAMVGRRELPMEA